MIESARALVDLLTGSLDFDHPERSFSPFESRFGVMPGTEAGAGRFVLYYNRRATEFERPVIAPASGGFARGETVRGPLGISSVSSEIVGDERIAFAAADTVVYEAAASLPGDDAGWEISVPGQSIELAWDGDRRVLTATGRLPRTDPRDPEPTFPFGVVVALPARCTAIRVGDRWREFTGNWTTSPVDGTLRLPVRTADGARAADGPWRAAMAVFLGDEGPDEAIDAVLRAARMDAADCENATARWIESAAPELRLPALPERWQRLYAACAWGLLSNTVRPHDRFGEFRSCFPNRARYCCHYLWDTCFASMALSRMDPELVEDGLRLLVARQEADGKIPQFLCATWNRPGASQPPLIAWAAWRLFEETGRDAVFADLYEPLTRWNRWWFTVRDKDRDGLAEYEEGLESGWDNSPRWDSGRVEPADLNPFLVVQMDRLARIAHHLGHGADARSWRERAAALRARIASTLWDPRDRIFYDARFDSHEPVRVRTPASFLPLWAGVEPPDPGGADRLIDEVLLSPDHFDGPIPFPVVARSEECYDPHGWWRGPVWMNIAHLMLETLGLHGRDDARRDRMIRLATVVEEAGVPRELYDSRTGEGLGAFELGWTCAVAMRWIDDLAATGWSG